MIKRLLKWLFNNRSHRGPCHYINPRNKHWLPPWAGLFLLFSLTCSGATVNWSVDLVLESGTPVNMGKAWLILGADSTATETAIQNGTFNLSGAKTVTNGKASGKLTASATAKGYVYLVILFEDKYSISAITPTKIPSTISFSGATWETVPEPSGLLLAGFLVLIVKRPKNRSL